jgi:Flp pilus assembly pilin Flp
MNFSKKSLTTERGQGLVEYTLIVLFVVLVFWVAVKSTTLDEALGSTWGKIQDCVGSPFTGSSSRSFKHSKLAGSVFTFTDQQIVGQNSMKDSDSAT